MTLPTILITSVGDQILGYLVPPYYHIMSGNKAIMDIGGMLLWQNTGKVGQIQPVCTKTGHTLACVTSFRALPKYSSVDTGLTLRQAIL